MRSNILLGITLGFLGCLVHNDSAFANSSVFGNFIAKWNGSVSTSLTPICNDALTNHPCVRLTKVNNKFLPNPQVTTRNGGSTVGENQPLKSPVTINSSSWTMILQGIDSTVQLPDPPQAGAFASYEIKGRTDSIEVRNFTNNPITVNLDPLLNAKLIAKGPVAPLPQVQGFGNQNYKWMIKLKQGENILYNNKYYEYSQEVVVPAAGGMPPNTNTISTGGFIRPHALQPIPENVPIDSNNVLTLCAACTAEFWIDAGNTEIYQVSTVPEPMTILGSLAVLGFGGLMKKNQSKKSN